MSEIIDRRNELSGNLALSQELFFIAKINELLAEQPSLGGRYKPINIRVVELDGDQLPRSVTPPQRRGSKKARAGSSSNAGRKQFCISWARLNFLVVAAIDADETARAQRFRRHDLRLCKIG